MTILQISSAQSIAKIPSANIIEDNNINSHNFPDIQSWNDLYILHEDGDDVKHLVQTDGYYYKIYILPNYLLLNLHTLYTLYYITLILINL